MLKLIILCLLSHIIVRVDLESKFYKKQDKNFLKFFHVDENFADFEKSICYNIGENYA